MALGNRRLTLNSHEKTAMIKQLLKHLYIYLLFSLPLMTGCNALFSKQPLQTTYYSLERVQTKLPEKFALNTMLKLPTLIVNMPKANAGFDTRRMMYTRLPHQLEYFAKNEWVDTPARMLQPLLVSIIEKTDGFKAVLPKYSSVKSDIRLESEIVQLIQIFNINIINKIPSNRKLNTSKPSQVQFTLRATLIDNVSNKVIASREFDEIVDAKSDDPIGGVLAANEAVNTVLEKLSRFTQDATFAWHMTMNEQNNGRH